MENFDETRAAPAGAQSGYGTLLKEFGAAAAEWVSNESRLAKREAAKALPVAVRHSARLGIGGAMILASLPPTLAFLVIGLGDLLGGRYALSALIVAVVLAGSGLFLCARTWRALKKEDFAFRATRAGFREGVRAIQNTFEKMTTFEERNDSHDRNPVQH